MGEELESVSHVFPSDWTRKKSHMKRSSEHSGHIFVIKHDYLETEVRGGTGDTVNQEASSPKRILPFCSSHSTSCSPCKSVALRDLWAVEKTLHRATFNTGYFFIIIIILKFKEHTRLLKRVWGGNP